MKKRWGTRLTAVCAAVLLSLSGTGAAEASESVEYSSAAVQVNGKNITAQWAAIDLLDPYLRVMPVTAEAGIGHVESFPDMVARSGAVAAVNGTFFDAYEADESLRHPNGLMIQSGGIIRSGENVALGIRTNKSAVVHPLETQLAFKIKHNGKAYTVRPWGVNTYYGGNADQVIAFTGEYAARIDKPGGMKAVIDNGRITAMTDGTAEVPEYGYVLYIGHSRNNDSNLLPNLHIGDEVEIEAAVADGSNWITEGVGQAWEAALGAGPKLVSGGKPDLDLARDGFTDPGRIAGANARSFVGVDGSGRLVMGTLSSATLPEMAQALVQLGLTEAMNLDGGASSGFYADGSIKRAPGRLLSNALVVKRYGQPQVQVAVNGQFVQESRGFIQQDVTMVPFRSIFERIGAQFSWNGDERVLKASRGKVELILKPDVAEATVNGKKVKLPQAPVIVDGHVYIPLRFAAETLGAKVGWDQELYRATLELK